MDRRFGALIASLVLVFSLTAGLAQAEPVKLNAPLAEGQYVGYNAYPEWNLLPTSPDGWWVVYNAVDLDFTAVKTYFALTTGWLAAPLYPEGYLPLAEDPGEFSPNGLWFVAPLEDPEGNYGLYSQFFPPLIGQPIRISQAMGRYSAYSSEFAFSPDGNRVLYTADLVTEQSYDLYSVPVWGGTPIQLGQSVTSYQVCPAGDRVVFTTGNGRSRRGLYSVPIAGGTVITLDDTQYQTSPFYPTLITSDGQRVIYANADGIVSQSVTGGAPILLVPASSLRLSSALTATSAVILSPVPQDPMWPRMRVSPDGDWLVYRQEDNDFMLQELLAVPVTGGTPVRLTLPWVSGTYRPDVLEYFQITPNSQRVVFIDYTPGDPSHGRSIMSVPISGGTPIDLGPAGGTSSGQYYFELTPNSRRVVGFFKGDVSSYIGSVPTTGGTPVVLSSQSRALRQFNITPNSQWVVFRSTESAFPTRDSLYRAPVQGGSLEWLASNMGANDVLNGTFVVTPNGRRVLYCKSDISTRIAELYANQIPPWLPF
jgi:Tol biopolymer transport system component